MQIRSRTQILGVSVAYLVLAIGLALVSVVSVLGNQTPALTEQPMQLLGLAAIFTLVLLPPVLWSARAQQRLALSQTQLQTQADSDPITGLLNRPAFVQRSTEQLQQTLTERPCTLVLLDLDFFPEFCETYGYPEADQVLQHFAAHLSGRVRENDLFCRIDREAFALLLIGANLNQATRLADRMVSAVESRPYSCASNGKTNILEFTASCGYADTSSAQDFETLFSNASSALLQAKRQGHNRAIAHQPTAATTAMATPVNGQTV